MKVIFLFLSLLISTVSISEELQVWGWGANNYGQLGLGDISGDYYIPVETLMKDSILVSAGGAFSLALRNDGTVWGWGSNYDGQLGDGTFNPSYSPVQVLNLNNVISISAGGDHSLALRNDGTVWAWGYNEEGQLGNGNNKNSNIPVQVPNLNNVVAISAKVDLSLALKSDGTVWSWGNDWIWRCPPPCDVIIDINPIKIPGLNNIVAISASVDHLLALRNDGTVWALGRNDVGQLGNGTFNWAFEPVQVLNLNNIIAISAGTEHSLALRNDGTVWAWGYNEFGELGNGDNNNSNIPVQVLNLNNVVAISAGGYHSLALKSDGTVWAWGYNEEGQLGNGNWYDSNVPVQVKKIKNPLSISAGADHSLAIISASSSCSSLKGECFYNYNIPVVARASGAYGTNWVSDLQVANPLPFDTNCYFFFFEKGKSNTESRFVPLTIKAKNSIKIEDVLLNLFGEVENYGGLRIKCEGMVKISSRTYNNQATGTYGQFIPAIEDANLLHRFTTYYIGFIEKSSNYRTNFGVLNLSDTELLLEVNAYNGNGEEIGNIKYEVPPYGFLQENEILSLFTTDDVLNGYIIVKSISYDSKYIAYASVVDNRTGDGIFILAK